MLGVINDIFNSINDFVWGPVMLVLLLGVGLFLMMRLNFMPLRKIGMAFVLLWKGRVSGHGHSGELSPFRALMTALAATIGTGNIAGVATAIYLGGPGAVFWMWCTALVGMATKFTEVTLAVTYREVTPDGSYVGGPMYYIRKGLGEKWKWMALAFAFFGCIAGFGIGNTVQVNSIADVMQSSFGVAHIWTAIILFVIVGMVLVGGVKRIGTVAGKVVPGMALFYIIASVICMIIKIDQVPLAFASIFTEAFNPSSVGGGIAGGSILLAMRFGIARGVFSNEAGMGSSPIAHATAITNNPVRQGIIGMLGTFLDTIVVCSMTAIVILISGLWAPAPTVDVAKLDAYVQAHKSEVVNSAGQFDPERAVQMLVAGQRDFLSANAELRRDNLLKFIQDNSATLASNGALASAPLAEGLNVGWFEHNKNNTKSESPLVAKEGAALTSAAFAMCLPGESGHIVVAIALALFAFTTILGWCVYSERCAVYLFGHRALKPFRLIYTLVVPVGALVQLKTVWNMADAFTALMIIPNIVALVLLSPIVIKKARDYFKIGEHSTEIAEVLTIADSVQDMEPVEFEEAPDDPEEEKKDS